ncbi:MAG: hypothetical protein J6C34_01665 [Oscillospiraceae bacterium]|nr:hypothetical protein [Oscillospiraceae bacterium]
MLLLQIYAVINKLLNPEFVIPPHEIDGMPVCYIDPISAELKERYKLDFDCKEPEAHAILAFLNAVFGGYTDSQICSAATDIEEMPEEVIDLLWPENKEEKCDALFMSIYSKCFQTEKRREENALLGKRMIDPYAIYTYKRFKKTWIYKRTTKKVYDKTLAGRRRRKIREVVFDLELKGDMEDAG